MAGAAQEEMPSCGVLVADRSGRCTHTNPRWNEILDCDPSRCLGDGWLQFLHPEDREATRTAWYHAVREAKEASFQVRVSATGGARQVRLQFSPMFAADGSPAGFLATLQDSIGHDRNEAQHLQAQKMESVGRLAGGLAHDFANLLTLISGYSEILLNRTDPRDPLRAEMEEIHSAANRGAGLTGQLLSFTRKQSVEPQVLDLNELVRDMERMLRRMIREDIALVTDLPPELGRVKADAGQIQQVIMNLAINARDAMPHAGQISIRTANVTVNEEQGARRRPGPYVMLQFADTGQGMDAETLSHMFEPFFTTKEKGKGTGLGLATVHGIVTQSNGYVFAHSEPGQGATFTIYLPRVEQEVEPRPQGGLPDRAESGTETILLVEDEAGVRRLLKHILTRSGYTALEASDGFQALEIFEGCGRQIDLLLTDIVMPRMSGRELAERLLDLRPDLKVLYMSGYTDELLVRSGALQAGASFLQKPLKPDVLVRKLREVLGRRPLSATSARK